MLHMLHAYDIMAILCHKIRLLDKEVQKDLFRAFWGNPESARQEIENMFSFLSRHNRSGPFVYNMLSLEEIQCIDAEIEKWSETVTDRKFLLYLLVYLDKYINFEESMELFLRCHLAVCRKYIILIPLIATNLLVGENCCRSLSPTGQKVIVEV